MDLNETITKTDKEIIIEKEKLSCQVKQLNLYLVTYWSQGFKVKGYLVVPKGEAPWPPVIYCRGGIRRVGMVRKRRIFSMARRGYVVFAPFYRGNEGGKAGRISAARISMICSRLSSWYSRFKNRSPAWFP